MAEQQAPKRGADPEPTQPAGDPAVPWVTPALNAALSKAQAEFPTIEKTKTAKVEKNGQKLYEYTYADLGDVLAAVRPVLSKHELALTQRTIDGGKMLITELRHVSGEQIESEVLLGQSSGNPQAYGGALTYLRRYEAVTLLGIAAEEDRDAQDVPNERDAGKPRAPSWARPATEAQKTELLKVLEELTGDRGRAREYAKTLADACEGFPGVVAAWVSALPGWQGQPPAQPPATDDEAAQAASGEPDPEPAQAPEDGPLAEKPAEDVEPEPEPEPEKVEPDRPEPGTVKDTPENRSRWCKCPRPHEPEEDFDREVHEELDDCPIHGVPF